MHPAIVSTRRSIRTGHSKKRGDAPRAAMESLENRRLLSSVVVNSIADPSQAGMVTLRDAITTANAATSPTQITFDPTVFANAQTIVLDGTELELSNSGEPTTITGPTAVLTLSGNEESRIFVVDLNVSVSISGLTLTQGKANVGGAIDNNSGRLTLDNSMLIGNTATAVAGGIYALGNQQTTMNEDTIANNTSNSEDGGIANYGGEMTITNSTISGNTSEAYGGGIENDATMTLVNDTIANNVTNSEFGGAIVNYGATAAITATNITVSGNTGNSATGGGIAEEGDGFVIANSIVAGNHVTGSGSAPDEYGEIQSAGHNLVGVEGSTLGAASNDLAGTAMNPLNPDLGSLENNSGPTATLLPLTGSPAIDAGSNALIPGGVTTDQRGFGRTVNGTVDIGADEVQLPPT